MILATKILRITGNTKPENNSELLKLLTFFKDFFISNLRKVKIKNKEFLPKVIELLLLDINYTTEKSETVLD